MSSIANITAASDSVELKNGRGKHVFTVTNTCSDTLTYGVKAVSDDRRQKVWFEISGPKERQLTVRQSDQISVNIQADPDVAAGKYTFHLLAYSTRSPGEDFTKSPTVAFVVKENGTAQKKNPPPPARSWLSLVALAIGIAALVFSLIAFLYLLKDLGSVRQQLADSMAIPGEDIPGLVRKVNDILGDIDQVKEDMRQKLGPQDVRVYTAGNDSAMALLSTNEWADFPELSKTFELNKESPVIAFYQVTMPGGDSHLVTRMKIDGKEARRTRAITGNTAYWSPGSLWSGTLSEGKHTITVEYRTPKGGANNPRTDWQNRALTIIVFGG